MSARDRDLERRFMTDALGEPLPPFAGSVALRLEAGEDEYGDSWTGLGIRRLLDELAEEAVDVGGWALLLMQTIQGDLDPTLRMEPDVAEVFIGVATSAVQYGAVLHHLLVEARWRLEQLAEKANGGDDGDP